MKRSRRKRRIGRLCIGPALIAWVCMMAAFFLKGDYTSVLPQPIRRIPRPRAADDRRQARIAIDIVGRRIVLRGLQHLAQRRRELRVARRGVGDQHAVAVVAVARRAARGQLASPSRLVRTATDRRVARS